ncbi:hypothetical protein [Garciella nitratireducens]|uniref:DUF2127 domain-containing protein n=1 Tax=Garciella nitratireducens DSM 15102 TaxID=1121911 RepID=A0A1T4KE96_9FIRM|nr:hypothetical protein [Garciella nitratireducens]SJZ40711.1 hypothetical protein SAMN02745973_00480 [Garciella nitratireducens DSM 15102]
MEYQENILAKSARRWVLALGIIDAIGVVISLIGLVSLMALKSTNYSSLQALGAAGEELIEIYKVQGTPLNLIIQGLLIIGQLVGVVLLFRGAFSIKKEALMDKTPFYLLFGIFVINNIFNWVVGTGEFSVTSLISILISFFLIVIPFWKVSKLNKAAEENRG